ncbi:DUF2304 domain-containing protein [Archaeoglobus sp. JdFR-39]|jgi:hypothetical protein|uniref:DUF2304 domain-containing protein n=1 Tax=Archaeoglobus sp. JdFR-39 TaxID=1934996 RepID=UPI0025B9C35F|nr:DUF2304 domain-containing protein [Archaeoglobus sp. JdFR-39]
MIKLIIPFVVGLLLLTYTLISYSKRGIGRKGLLLSLFVSFSLIISPVMYGVILAVAKLLGFYYSFVFVFLVSILALFILIIYIIRKINELDNRNIRVIQEISLLKAEIDELRNKHR